MTEGEDITGDSVDPLLPPPRLAHATVEPPRLPPAATPTPPVVPPAPPAVQVEAATVAPRPPAKSPEPARRRAAAALCLLLVGGAVAVGMLVMRSTGSEAESSATVAHLTNPSSTLAAIPATTSPPATIQALTPSTSAITTTPPSVGVFGGITSVDLSAVDQCRTEQRIVFAALQAFVNETGGVPDHPDVLVGNGWLEPHPDGWSPRWRFEGRDGAIYVVPVSGGGCAI